MPATRTTRASNRLAAPRVSAAPMADTRIGPPLHGMRSKFRASSFLLTAAKPLPPPGRPLSEEQKAQRAAARRRSAALAASRTPSTAAAPHQEIWRGAAAATWVEPVSDRHFAHAT